MTHAGETVKVLRLSDGPSLDLVARGGQANAIVRPDNSSGLRSLHRIQLEPNGETITLQHPHDAVYYVAAGEGEVTDVPRNETQALIEGAMVHVDAGTLYRFCAHEPGAELLGGPAPADPSLYREA
jgi:quercetin dioxygenase-like cupin family protein